jgi:hypothetical protein
MGVVTVPVPAMILSQSRNSFRLAFAALWSYNKESYCSLTTRSALHSIVNKSSVMSFEFNLLLLITIVFPDDSARMDSNWLSASMFPSGLFHAMPSCG